MTFNNFSAIATISSLLKSEKLSPYFSCSSNSNLPQNSLGSDDENIVEIPEAMKAGEIGIFLGGRCRVDLLFIRFTSKFISFGKSYPNCLSDRLAKSTL